MRAVIWLLAAIATAGAVYSIGKVLRDRNAEDNAGTTQAVILPSAGKPQPSANQTAAGAIESATKNATALMESTGVSIAGRRGESARDDGSPAFDIARVEPSGDAVIAGRASPGATVELLRNGVVHDRVVADASGQFAMVPPRLPVGDSELTLRAKRPGGAATISKQSVVVAVQPNLRDQPVVALMTPDKPSIVLSKPQGLAASGGSVIVEAVEAEPGGKKLYVSGRSSPRASVRLYLNDKYQGATTADANGRFTFTALKDSVGKEGDAYQVRLDEVDVNSGAVRSRAEVPFTQSSVVAAASAQDAGDPRGSAAVGVKAISMTVTRGDTLWHISRTAYGNGARYMTIYDANHNQIRNPDRIYPGQIFIIPRSAQR
jgi:hypothetical protein